MQIENEELKFVSPQWPVQFKSKLTDLQIQYLAQFENKATIQQLILGGLKNGWLVNFVQLYSLIQKLVENKLIMNKNFYKYFSEIGGQSQEIKAIVPPVAPNQKKLTDIKKDFKELIKLPFLRSLNPEVATALLEKSEIIDFAAESLICRKGDVASRKLFIMLSGEAAIYGQGQQAKKFICLLKTNAVFGEMGFFLGVPRTADIVAVRQCKILVISGDSDFMNENMNSEKAEHLVHRFWIQQALLGSEIFKNIPTESIDELTFGGDIVRISKDQILFSEKEMTNGAYIVVQGQFSVQINKKVVAHVSQGQMIGEISLFKTQGLRSATVTAEKDSVLMHISLQKFYQLLSHNLYLAKTLQELSQVRFDQNKN